MLSNWLYSNVEYLSVLNVFKYVSFRAMGAFLTSLILTIALGNYVISLLKSLSLGQLTKGYEPKKHKLKEGTPTMGGLLFIFTTIITLLLWGDWSNAYLVITVFAFIGFGVIGLIDDLKKTIYKNPEGISALTKFTLQVLMTLAILFFIVLIAGKDSVFTIDFPVGKLTSINLSYLYIIFAILVIAGTSNAVNITDGLDGLAIMPAVIAFATLGAFAYIVGNQQISEYLYTPFVEGSYEMVVFCAAMVGAGIGFLWFNASPAQVFMGDIGSLSIGGSLGTIAIIVKQEINLIIICGVFLIETLSVIIQVGYFKITHGKRVFKMAPLHHHFELTGVAEQKIVTRFWILSLIFAVFAFITLKLR